MAQFKAKTPGIEVNGETVLSIVNGLGAFQATARTILAQHGIDDPQPGQWYPLQAFLDAFAHIAQRIGPATLTMIGRAIPDNAQFPPDVNNFDAAMASIDVAYHMNHRRDGRLLFNTVTGKKQKGIGNYLFKSAGPGENKATLVCNNPYPCDFDRGIIEAMAKRFPPQGSTFVRVNHDVGACRKQGDESCTYIVSWR